MEREDVDGGDVALDNPFPIEITDGTNGKVSVKASTTAALNTDPSLVIAISPNSPLPTGDNNIGSVSAVKSTTTNQTTVAASLTNVVLLTVNANRIGATVFNSSSSILYLILGSTASTTSFTVQINSGGYYETPFAYSGVIAGIWSGADGSAFITELT